MLFLHFDISKDLQFLTYTDLPQLNKHKNDPQLLHAPPPLPKLRKNASDKLDRYTTKSVIKTNKSLFAVSMILPH